MKFDVIGAIIGIAATGVVAIGTAIYSYVTNKNNRRVIKNVCDNLDQAVEDLDSKDVVIDISEKLINDVAKAKVEREVDYRMSSVVKQAMDLAAKTMSDAVTKELNEQYADIKLDLKRELENQIGRIDISSVRKQVVRDAKEEAKREFKSDLEDLLDELRDKGTRQIDEEAAVMRSFKKRFAEV